jgi:SAM-dependent methyltransferase
MIKFFKKIPFINNWIKKLDNANERIDFIKKELLFLEQGLTILDAGCGSQMFKQYCSHLIYKSQDFGQYSVDEKKVMDGSKITSNAEKLSYQYGNLDYKGNIWKIEEKNDYFDAILCTEVFEHIPYPIDTVKEFSRLLKKKGKLILTAPSNSLRHFDPFYFYSGFSDRWFEKILPENNLKILSINPIGDYYSWLGVELARTAMSHSFFSKIVLLPSFFYFFAKKKTKISTDTLCMGYFVVAEKI